MKLFKATITALLGLAIAMPTLAKEEAATTPNIDQIKERGTLRVGMSTFVPWAMRNKQGELIGF
ncbi:amino acid ABC transporter substrate-binding protein, partial [Vibrio parahaemolyticus]|nr:amino acid ABC transporter substrate-binding protein [Vibrio parahaemolyticus]